MQPLAVLPFKTPSCLSSLYWRQFVGPPDLDPIEASLVKRSTWFKWNPTGASSTKLPACKVSYKRWCRIRYPTKWDFRLSPIVRPMRRLNLSLISAKLHSICNLTFVRSHTAGAEDPEGKIKRFSASKGWFSSSRSTSNTCLVSETYAFMMSSHSFGNSVCLSVRVLMILCASNSLHKSYNMHLVSALVSIFLLKSSVIHNLN